VGYQGNGAIIHYKPALESAAAIKNEGILLVDSGGQYLDGTTDITRTISFDEPRADIKKAYTLVLQGHIELATAVFPVGTNGAQLDILARKPLWDNGMNYLHGTGHGVGFFLNVHEGPQGFAAGNSSRAICKFQPGMITSNEPGYYVDNDYGIRIENLIACKESSQKNFLEFETITLFPISTDLIDKSLLTTKEITWINDYNKESYDKISPLVDETHRDWLKKKCQSI